MRTDEMKQITREQLLTMGIDLPDVDVPIGSLSGGQKQCVAIARAVSKRYRCCWRPAPTSMRRKHCVARRR